MNTLFRYLSFVALFVTVHILPAHASHYLGSELTCMHLGNNQYNIIARFYQDCLSGQTGAIDQDIPVPIAIYRGDGTFVRALELPLATTTVIPPSALPGCLSTTAGSCVSTVEAAASITLPPSATGYVFVSDRCCAPAQVVNILSPANQGIAMRAVVPPTPNATPRFRAIPPARVCAGTPFSIDMGAIDADGDPIRYTLATPFSAGSTNNDPKPSQASFATQPVSYAGGYSMTAPAGVGSQLVLDTVTGRLSGTINFQATYLLAVRASDYSGGNPLSTVQRTYALLVVPCQSEPDASIARDDAAVQAGADSISIVRCGGARTVQFENTSAGASGYWWDFGDTATGADVSTAANPSYTYPGPGNYLLTLVALGPNCNDTLRTLVVLSDETEPAADFTTDAQPLCAGLTYAFRSSPDNANLPAQNVAWRFVAPGGSEILTAYGTPVTYATDRAGTLSVRHVVVSAGGCIAAVQRDIDVQGGNVTVSADTTVVKDTRLIIQASGGASYRWEGIPPATLVGLGSSTDAAQQVYTGLVDTAMRFVCVSTGLNGCRDYDTVRVAITERAYTFVPNAFSPNGDGLNDVLRPRLSGANLYQFVVHNRYGQEVFRSRDPRVGWDGTFAGQPLQMGTFFWMARLMPPSGGIVVESGDVTLIR